MNVLTTKPHESLFKSVLAILLSVMLLSPAAAQNPSNATRTIHVQGEGKVTVIPDFADIRVRIAARNPDAQAAVKKTSATIATLIEALKNDYDIAATDLQTHQLKIHPVYINCHDRRRLKQLNMNHQDCQSHMLDYYQTERHLNATIRDLEDLDDIMMYVSTLAPDSGVTVSISQNQLQSSKLKEMQDKARLQAAANARDKAEQIAQALNTEIGEVQNITLGHISMPKPQRGHLEKSMRTMAMAADTSSATQSMAAGSIDITATVQATFALK